VATAREPVWEQWLHDEILPLRQLTVGDWWGLLAHRPYTVPAVAGIMQVPPVWGSVVNSMSIVDWMVLKLSDDEGIAIAEYYDGTNGLYLLTLSATVTQSTVMGSAGANWQLVSGGSGGGPIADGSVTTAKLADNAVTSAKITDGAIQTVDIAPGAITSALIATGAVTSTQIADGGIQTVDLALGSVTTPIIQDGAVTGPKIPSSTITSAHILDGTVQGVDIANGAVGTAQIANGAITNPLIGPKAVDTPQLADGCVTNQQLGLNSVTSWNIADGTIQAIDIANQTITEQQLAANSVGTAELITASVTTAKIANGAVTDPLIASVGWAKITGAPTSMPPSGAAGGDLGAVGSTYPNPVIAPGAVTTAKIADAPNGVTDAKISSVSWGKITGTPSSIAPSGPASGDLTGTYPGPTIAAAVVTNAKMAANSVQTAQIVDANVTNAKISSCDWSKLTSVPSGMPPSGAAGGSLTASYPNPLIAAAAVMRSMLGSDVTPSLPPLPTVPVANQIVSVNATGTALIYTAQPPANLTPGQVSNQYLAADAVTTDKILNGTILGADIAASTVADANIIGLGWGKLTGVPTVFPPDPTKLPWTVGGGSITPTDPTKTVACAVTNAFQWGGATVKGRLVDQANAGDIQLRVNVNAATALDDATKASWILRAGPALDLFLVQRAPAGSTTYVNILLSDNAGNLTILGATATKASGTTWANPSDPRLKEDIAPYARGVAEVVQLEPITYRLKADPDGATCYGFDASAVQPVFPECVTETSMKLSPDDVEETAGVLAFDMHPILVALVNAVKELAARVAALETA
jgi:hypothetical protein